VNDSIKLQQENPKLIIARGLAEFFKDEPHKIALWLLLPNPMFGNITPAELIVIRGHDGLRKVANFIQSAQELT
jgi:hypothetical protein